MVQVVIGFLDDTPNIDVKLSVIETLRTVTEGKVSTSFSGTGYHPRGGSFEMLIVVFDRFLLKWNGLVLPVSFHKSKRHKAI